MDDVHDDAMVFAVTAPVDLPGDFGSRILLQMVTVRPSLEARYPPLWAGTVPSVRPGGDAQNCRSDVSADSCGHPCRGFLVGTPQLLTVYSGACARLSEESHRRRGGGNPGP
jgi:hypothetical protein